MESPAPPDPTTWLHACFAEGIRPDPRRTVAEWAEAARVVSEGASQGPWSNARAPYLTEPMEKLSLAHPARHVTLLKSSQVGGTQVGLNLIGQILAETPANVLVVLPSDASVQMYNRDKLDLMIQASPSLTEAVAEITSHSTTGSTTRVKKGRRGAQVELVSGATSKNLQSRTVRVVIREEISEYLKDVDGRGDPADLAFARTLQWRAKNPGEKVFDCSTPSIKGECRVTKFYEQGSRATWQVPCPHCGHRQPLAFPRLTWPKDRPQEAAYLCAGPDCGALLCERDKRAMNAAGAWVHECPELADIHPSYAINILASPFTPWSEVAREADLAEGDALKLKTFTQQLLGEAWDEAFDLPKPDILMLRRDAWPPGRIPPAVLFLMGATDVQADRLVWAVWGFDRSFGQWLIDTGTIPGDPTRPEPWAAHDVLLRRAWNTAWDAPLKPDAWGIDSGYLSSHVYAYARRHAADSRPEIRALDGRDRWKLPPIGTPTKQDVSWNGTKLGEVNLYPVGTWDMKSELAGALRLTEQGPGPTGWPEGAIRFNETIDRAWLQEMLSEQLLVNPRTGLRAWKKIAPRNEAWDLAVYTRALARHATLRLTEADWAALSVQRQGPPAEAQPDLGALWSPDLKAQAEAAAAAPPPPPPPPAKVPPPAFIPRRSSWITPGRFRL